MSPTKSNHIPITRMPDGQDRSCYVSYGMVDYNYFDFFTQKINQNDAKNCTRLWAGDIVIVINRIDIHTISYSNQLQIRTLLEIKMTLLLLFLFVNGKKWGLFLRARSAQFRIV